MLELSSRKGGVAVNGGEGGGVGSRDGGKRVRIREGSDWGRVLVVVRGGGKEAMKKQILALLHERETKFLWKKIMTSEDFQTSEVESKRGENGSAHESWRDVSIWG